MFVVAAFHRLHLRNLVLSGCGLYKLDLHDHSLSDYSPFRSQCNAVRTCNVLFGCKAINENDLQEDIVNAMALTGQFLMGQAVMVKSSEVNLFVLFHMLAKTSKPKSVHVAHVYSLACFMTYVCHVQTLEMHIPQPTFTGQYITSGLHCTQQSL